MLVIMLDNQHSIKMYEETLLVKGMKQESPIIIKNVQIMYKGGYLAVLNFRKIDR